MKLVKQFNEWSCVFACIESFLVDNDRPFSHEAVVTDPARPIIDGEGNIGGYASSWQFDDTLAKLLLGRGLKSEDLARLAQPSDPVKAGHLMRKILQLTRPEELMLLNLDTNPLRDFGSRFGFDVLNPTPLIHPEINPQAFPPLAEGTTYLILTANYANNNDFHCLRSNGETYGDRLIVMNPKEGVRADYPFSLIFQWKSFFVPLRFRPDFQ